MSVSNAGYGVCRKNDGGSEQFIFKSTNETSYGRENVNGIEEGWFIGALGQDADQQADTSGNWSASIKAPFPGQCTTVMYAEEFSGMRSMRILSTSVQEIRVINDTIIPVFDDSASMWQDLAASVVHAGDSFITVSITNMDNLDALVTVCTANDGDVDSIVYFQIRLQSADYYCVGSKSSWPAIFIAWDTGTAIW